MAAYFSARRRTSFSGRSFRSSVTCRIRASRSASPVASGSMCAPADRLLDDLVDDLEPQQVLGRELERLGGALALARVLPQDRGAALGRDHRVDRVLQHQDPVGDAERERAARAALADDHGDDGRRQRRHLEDVARHRLGLAALLGAEAGVGARRVDERDDRAR